ncbi:hypothetical protein CL621_00410 [archaeon]|nr:hypothetical protein [archaeon]|tara:strand:- start:147 stop:443 length:297 start_codon:yes stop_codon:yes gene_type:complete
MQEVKRLNVLSVAKITALFGIFFGLVAGILFAIVSKLSVEAMPAELAAMPFGMQSIFILPIFYGITYFLGGIVGAAIYNLFAKWIGGIKIDLSKEGKK